MDRKDNKIMNLKKACSVLLAAAMLAGVGAVSSGCGSSGDTAASGGEKEKIVVANWQSYATDFDYGAAVFEEEYGCEVEFYFISSIPELLSTLQNGGMGQIDVVNINPLYLQQYMDAGVLDTIDVSQLANYNDLREDFRTLDVVYTEDGGVIGVPWIWGTTSMFYNADIITDEPTSWSALWDPQYAGMVTLEDEYDTAIRSTALYAGEDPYNPDTAAVQQALIDLKPSVKTYWASHDDFVKAYTSGEIAIGNVWGSIATELIADGYNIKYVHPDEGTVGWCDYWCMVKNSEHTDLAMKWIDFCTGPEFQNNMATAGVQVWAPVNSTVADQLSDETKQKLWMYPEAPDNVTLAMPLTDDVLAQWTGLWDEVKAAN